MNQIRSNRLMLELELNIKNMEVEDLIKIQEMVNTELNNKEVTICTIGDCREIIDTERKNCPNCRVIKCWMHTLKCDYCKHVYCSNCAPSNHDSKGYMYDCGC